MVETSRGRTLGQIVFGPREVTEAELSGALKPVVRRATAWDMVQADQMTHREPDALSVCRERVAALRMDIKVVKVEFSLDGSSAVVYFTSEQRVDFRNLVHDLSQALHTRVEMRQVGVRDEAKFLGGYGRCGRELCCATWLREFAPVSIKMAKTQDLPLNAPKFRAHAAACSAVWPMRTSSTPKRASKCRGQQHRRDTPGARQGRQVHVLTNSITVLVEGPERHAPDRRSAGGGAGAGSEHAAAGHAGDVGVGT